MLSTQERGIPLTLSVRRKDGTVHRVRLGVMVPGQDGLTLQVGETGLERLRELLMPPPQEPAPRSPSTSIKELELCAEWARRTLSDPTKARWHERERAVLAEIEVELARRRDQQRHPPPHHIGR